MKKRTLSLLFALITTIGVLHAQNLSSTAPNGSFTADDIEHWVGEGDNEIGIILIYKNTSYEQDNLVFGYRFSESSKSIEAILNDINNLDTRFRFTGETQYGMYSLSNFELDLDQDGTYEYTVPSSSYCSTYSNGSYLYSNISGNKWISLEAGGYSSVVKTVTYTPISFGVVTCPAPKNINISGITTSQANITWEYSGSENQFFFYYKKSSDQDFDSLTVTGNTYSLINLESNTSYDIRLATICTGEVSKYSSKKSFRTKCQALSSDDLPYTENFDSYGTDFPYCWSIVSSVTTSPAMVTTKHSGTRSLQVSSPSATAYSVSPELAGNIDMTKLKINFWALGNGTSTTDSSFMIGLSSNAEGDNFEALAQINPEASWKQYEIRLDNKTFDATKRFIAIKAENNGNSRKLFIDDFQIQLIPECEHPVITQITLNPGSQVVNVAYQKGHDNDQNVYIYYQKQGSDETDSVLAQSNPVDITLELSSVYNIWAKTWCSNYQASDIFETLSLTTPCANLQVPFGENFDDLANNTFPMCMTKKGGNSAGAGTYEPYSGTGKSLSAGHSSSSADLYIILPYLDTQFDIEDLRFSFCGKGYSYDQTVEVGVLSNIDNADSFTKIKELTLIKGEWNKYDVDFDSYQSEGRYIALLFKNPKNGYQTIYLDEFAVDFIPSCDKPTELSITQNEQNTQSVDISFTKANDYDNEWIVYYKKQDQSEYLSQQFNENPFTLNNLDIKSTYSFYLTTLCGTKESEPSTSVEYSTPCYGGVITEFPYTEDFEQDGLRCLSQEEDAKWESAGEDQRIFTYPNAKQGSNYARLHNISTSNDSRLILPAMNLSVMNQPVISFWHIQAKWSKQDTLTVLYRTSKDGEWQTIKQYSEEIPDWQLEYLALPEPSAYYQIAFDGKFRVGKGIGIDSIVVRDYVCENPVVNITDSLCQGSIYTLYGNDYTQAGNFTITRQGLYNCDTTVNLTLTYKHPYDSVMQINLCQGNILQINNTVYDHEGEYDFTITSTESCDTNVHMIITTIYPSDTTINATVNQGDMIEVAQEYFWEQGSYTRVIPNAQGCDSTITINLTVIPIDSVHKNDAIPADDQRIVSWVSGIELYRDSAYGNYYDAIGQVINTKYVCLGDTGSAMATFNRPIADGDGYDFAVFSHGVKIKTAFVEVSSNGKNYFRFPSHSSAVTNNSNDAYVSDNYSGLAGVYPTGYGTAFDLNDLPDHPALNKYNVRFVRIITVKTATDKDNAGNVIYDDNSGFNLAGIGIINAGVMYNVADMENLLTDSNSYEIVSPAVQGVIQDGNGEYYKNYESGGLYFKGQTMYSGAYAMGFGASNVTDYTTSTGNGLFTSYYASSATAGSEGKGKGYLQAFYSDYGGTPQHNTVETYDASEFYPQGVYVSNSVSSYYYNKTNSKVKKGYHKVIAVGYDAQGQKTDTAFVYLEEEGVPYKDWKYLNLSALGKVSKVVFKLESNYQMAVGSASYLDIPAYFCIDNFVYTNRPYTVTSINATVCQGEEVMGKNETGTYLINDTVLKLTVNPLNTETVDTVICAGNVFEFNGKQYSASQTVIDTVTAAAGSCDTVYTINLTVLEEIVKDTTITINNKHLPYIFENLTLTAQCDTSVVYTGQYGCDSTLNIHLNVVADELELAGFDTSVCAGVVFEFNNKSYTSSQTIIDTVVSLNDADTVYTINLTVKDAITEYDTVTIEYNQRPYIFGDLSLNNSCDTVWSFLSYQGCDSTVYLHLTVKEKSVFDTVFDTVICANSVFEFNGKEYSTSQIINDTVRTDTDTDTAYTVNLTVREEIITYDTVSISSEQLPYSFGTLSLTESCDTSFVFESAQGCDSTVYLHLDVTSSLYSTVQTVSVKVYPNPASENVFINTENLHGNAKITVTDMSGKIIISKEVTPQENIIKLNVRELEAGPYLVSVISEDFKKSIKLIVK